MAAEKNMISDLHFSQLEQANQRLAQNWNMLVKMRANGNLGETSHLIKAEMAYLHSLQLVMDAAESAILDEERQKRTKM
ncbi:hypothetical protein F4212_06215 [Candidatus Poribacteria bacterium]|nr:hypothetical protein [Candidatus Poribacteria bacterium]